MMSKQEWITMTKVLVVSSIVTSIGNAVNTWKTGAMVNPIACIPGLAFMILIIWVSCAIQGLVAKVAPKVNEKLPTILYITMVTVLLSIPGFSPVAQLMADTFAPIGFLPLCTPILAYAGISLGKDMGEFKKQGIGIVVVALCTFAGTYVGSALIAQIILKVTGVI